MISQITQNSLRQYIGIVQQDNGEIAEQGSHFALLKKNGLYAALWEAQLKNDN